MTAQHSTLPRSFFDRPVRAVARDLLGATLVRLLETPAGDPVRLSGTIVEVEAYDGPRDRACHASKGRTARTDVMFGPPGHAYVYLIYGMHSCLNVVTGPEGYPAAVLIRALEPIEGIGRMDGDRSHPARIAAGPGRLTRALGITRSLNRIDLCGAGPLRLEAGSRPPRTAILRGPRIGVDYAGDWARRPWRFGVRGSQALSRPFPGRGKSARSFAGGGPRP